MADVRAASIGVAFSDPRVSDVSFRSPQTWIDRDVLLLRLDRVRYEYPSYDSYRGAPSLGEYESARIREDFRRRRNELAELLKLGRTLVLFLAPPDHWYVDTGERTYSGTGRNRQTTRIVDRMELYSLLPFAMSAVSASTRDLELATGEPFAAFWRVMRDRFEAAARITSDTGTPTLKIRGTDAVVGSILRVNGGGIVIVLPQELLYYSADEDGDVADELSEDAGGDHVGQIQDEHADEDELDQGPLAEDVEFLDALFELIRALRADAGDFEQPAWSHEFSFAEERKKRAAVRQADEVAADALIALDAAKSAQAGLVRRKILLTGTGRAFEIVVHEAFEALGFTVREGEPGRTDRIIEVEGFPPAVVETKGLAKSAAEADAAQLEKWVSEYYVAEGVQPKGLLVVNTWRDLPISDRTEESFPDQMLRYAADRGHCLITGAQLLGAWIDTEARLDAHCEVLEALYNTRGRFALYTDWSAFLEREEASIGDGVEQASA